MEKAQLAELVLQSLEHERGGVKVYQAALECAVNEELREEWEKYLEETRTHVERLERVCATLGLDAEDQTPGRAIVKDMGTALVRTMQKALETGTQEAAELDRKSTRLNSSHVEISYAVFCLKKKIQESNNIRVQ